MVIDAATFAAVGGYSPSMRHHEALDLAVKLHQQNVPRLFDPLLEAVHHCVDVCGARRSQDKRDARAHLVRIHGRGYLMRAGLSRQRGAQCLSVD